MGDGTVTLKERHRREMERMEQAIAAIDAALADFPAETSIAAAGFAEKTCFANGMTPDAHAGAYLSA